MATKNISSNRLLTGENIVLFSIVLLGVVLRASWMLKPNSYYLVDEVYYIPAALHYLAPLVGHLKNVVTLFTEDRWAPYYINPEHPPLGKLLISLSVWVFGNNPLGWRLPSTIFGSIGIIGVYLAAKKTSPRTALMAATIYAVYPLEISMSQIGMLDVFSTTFLAFSFAALVSGKPRLAALLLGLSTASKLPGIVGWLPLIYYVLINNKGAKKVLREFFIELIIFYLAFVVWFTPMVIHYTIYSAILDQYYMVAVQGAYGPGPGAITPIMWLFSFTQPTFNPTLFLNNPILTALCIPSIAYSAIQLRRDPKSIFVLALFLASYGLIISAAVARPIYLFYFEDASPAFTLISAYFLQGLLNLNSKPYTYLAYALFASIVAVSALTIPVVLFGFKVPYTKILIKLSY
jgi:predicted membrane-bound dolichyl-phosphate-mannose-protein mannosyltransferase